MASREFRVSLLFVFLFGIVAPGDGLAEEASVSFEAATAEPATARPQADGSTGGLHFTNLKGEPLAGYLRSIILSASARIRPEYTDNYSDFNRSVDDEFDFTSARFRFGIGANLAYNLGFYIEAQSNSIWGGDPLVATMEDDLSVYQGYIEAREIGDLPVSVRLGRQELVYGNEMFLGDADFGTGLSHDALKLTYGEGPVWVDFIYSKETERNATFSPTGTPVVPLDDDVDLFAIYGNYEASDNAGIDVYWIFLRDPDALGGEQEIHTLGTRGYLEFLKYLYFDGEFAWQFGDSGSADNKIRAFGVETFLGVDMKDVILRPGAKVGYTYASGDPDPTDSKVETFNPLFQDNHPRLGLSDLLFMENLHAITINGTVRPFPELDLAFGLGFYGFWVDDPEDTGAPRSLAGGTGTSQHIGDEIDVFIDYHYQEHLFMQLAWAYFIPGGYTQNQFGSRSSAHRVYLHMVIGF